MTYQDTYNNSIESLTFWPAHSLQFYLSHLLQHRTTVAKLEHDKSSISSDSSLGDREGYNAAYSANHLAVHMCERKGNTYTVSPTFLTKRIIPHAQIV